VSLLAVSLSGQVRDRTRDSMKIPSTSNSLIGSKLCAQSMFCQDDEVERWKDVEVLDSLRFPLFGGHTTNVESETVERSSRGERGRRLLCLLFITISVTKYWARPFTE